MAGRADSTSSLRIRPPTPVPLTLAKFTPSSDANLRTIGVTYASAGCETGAEAAGVTGATTGAAGVTGAGGGVAGAAGTGAGGGVTGAAATGCDYTFNRVDQTIAANANKVTAVSVSTTTPALGGTVVVTVNGATGQGGAGQSVASGGDGDVIADVFRTRVVKRMAAGKNAGADVFGWATAYGKPSAPAPAAKPAGGKS